MSFSAMLQRRRWAIGFVLLLTGVLGAFAVRVRPDYSIEMLFPTFDHSRRDYERFKKDFPFEDAHALVVVEAPDLFTPAGLAREQALEQDLARIPGVIDTEGLTSVKDIVADGDAIRTDRVFPRIDAPAAELARGRRVATSDPLFAWNLAPPDGRATTIRVTLTKEHASKDATRTAFMLAARKVLADHDARARAAGATQKLTLNGLPIIRSEFTELINGDLGRLFPIALAVILLLLYVTFRNAPDVAASLITIGFSVVWTYGVMGLCHVPIQVLTQITPIVVMIVSISDTVHIVSHTRDLRAHGMAARDAIAEACRDSAIPCLLTEITIAGGFLALMTNDMVMIQQFGAVTAAGMLLTWLANVTVLPLAMSFLSPKQARARDLTASAAETTFRRCVGWVEQTVLTKPRAVVVTTALIALGSLAAGTRAGKEYYSYDDLRPESRLARNLRYVESIHGGTVPLAIFVEPSERREGAMLEPAALALIDRIGRKMETEFAEDVKNTSSLAKYLRKAHRLLAGEDVAARAPLPQTRALAAQELLAVDDPRALRDVVSFDRGAAAVFTMMPDRGSSRATKVIERLNRYFAQEQAQTGYRITLTGIYGIADGIYRSLVGGLVSSLGLAVLISFGIFCLVLRSWKLAGVGLVPNVLPLLFTLGFMSLLHIDIKPSTVIIFSITLVIADDDTIQYLSRFRTRYLELCASGHPSPHQAAAIGTLRETGLPMFITACAVSLGFLTLLRSEFLGLANLGLLIGVSLLSAVFADLFLSPLLLIHLKPKLRGAATKTAPVDHERAAG
jgi:predicted RND superfamily exporter protein